MFTDVLTGLYSAVLLLAGLFNSPAAKLPAQAANGPGQPWPRVAQSSEKKGYFTLRVTMAEVRRPLAHKLLRALCTPCTCKAPDGPGGQPPPRGQGGPFFTHKLTTDSALIYLVIQAVNALGLTGMEEAEGLEGAIKVMADLGLARVQSVPYVVAPDGTTRRLSGRQFTPVPMGSGKVGEQFKEFGTRLNVVPSLLKDGKSHLEIALEAGLDPTLGTTRAGAVVPGRTTQRIHITAELYDRQTFVIRHVRSSASDNALVRLFKCFTASDVVVLVTPFAWPPLETGHTTPPTTPSPVPD